MATFREKVEELCGLPPGVVENEALAFLETIGDWPVNTEVRIGRMAFLIVALMNEQDPNVRRVTVSEAINLRSSMG